MKRKGRVLMGTSLSWPKEDVKEDVLVPAPKRVLPSESIFA